MKNGAFHLLPELFSGYRFSDVLRSIREFCNRNNAVLVLKTREKNIMGSQTLRIGDLQRRLYQEYSDLWFSDEQYYPYTSLELMGVADLAIHFKSSAILELLAVGVPNITVVFPFLSGLLEIMKQFHEDGLSTKLSCEDVIAELPSLSLSDFKLDHTKRKSFVDHYLSWPRKKGSSEIVNSIVRVVSGG